MSPNTDGIYIYIYIYVPRSNRLSVINSRTHQAASN